MVDVSTACTCCNEWLADGEECSVGNTQKGDIVKDLMKTCFDNGINMFDNAEAYSAGESEREMGRVIEELGWDRRDIIITTKIFFGTQRGETQNTRGLSRKHIVEGLNVSLKNLRLDYVDIVFAHRPDRTVPMEEIVRAFNHVIDRESSRVYADDLQAEGERRGQGLLLGYFRVEPVRNSARKGDRQATQLDRPRGRAATLLDAPPRPIRGRVRTHLQERWSRNVRLPVLLIAQVLIVCQQHHLVSARLRSPDR